MTNKEAVRVFGNLKLFHDDDNEIYEACNMAIEALNTHDELCENLAWYINERQRLLKVIEYSKPNEGLHRTIKKALERPHGKWKYIGTGTVEKAKCSVCSKITITEPFGEPPFCQWCGSQMKGSE